MPAWYTRGVRHWKRNAVIVAALALGIGANVAIFSALDAVLLRSLPVQKPEQIYLARNGLRAHSYSGFASAVIQQMRAVAPGAQFASFTERDDLFEPRRGAPPLPVAAQLVSTDYFQVLGVRAGRGRLLDAGDRDAAVVVLSDGYWQRQYGHQPVLGRTLTLNGVPLEIVGVTPYGFYGLSKARPAEVWVPQGLQQRLHYAGSAYMDSGRGSVDTRQPWSTQSGIHWLQVVARVPDAAALAGIAAAATAAERRIEAPYVNAASPGDRRRKSRDAVWFVPGGAGLGALNAEMAAPLRLLLGMAGLVLLIACADVALLQLAQGLARRRDWAVRLALGAGQGRIARQELSASLRLAGAGAAGGLALAVWGRSALMVLLGVRLPAGVMALDGRVLGFSIAAALVTGVLFGLAPAWLAARVNMHEALTAESGGQHAAHTGAWRWLVGAQVALSLGLLLAASLLSFSFVRLLQRRSGFAASAVLSASLAPRAAGYTLAQLPALEHDLLERLQNEPGVEAVTLAQSGVLTGSSFTSYLSVESGGVQHASAQEDMIAPGFFRTLGIPLLRGRRFRARDDASAARVIIVNQTFVRRYLHGRQPLGAVVNDFRDASVVGVVADARINGVDRPVPPMVYHPLAQHPPELAYPGFLAVRFQGGSSAGFAEMRQAVAQVAPGMPVLSLHALPERLRAGLGSERALAELSGAFALLALLLAGLGIYGVMSCAVAQRQQEVGIRMALGARPGQILRLVLRSAGVTVGLGMAAGLAAALPLTGLLRHELHGLEPLDPPAIALAVGLLAAVGLAAAYGPARRAARLAPAAALRRE